MCSNLSTEKISYTVCYFCLDTLCKTSLWQFLFESSPFLPEPVLAVLLQGTVEQLKNNSPDSDLSDIPVWTGLGRAARCLKPEEQLIKGELTNTRQSY